MGLPPLAGTPAADGSDCVGCGRCCHHGPHTVSVLETDEARLGQELLAAWTEVLDRPPYFRFVKNTGERCAALLVTDDGRFPCALYEARPQGCRDVEPGSPCCLEARALGHLGKSVEFRRR